MSLRSNTTNLPMHLAWADTPRCTCPHEWKSFGRLYGISMGRGWVRMKDDPACPNHGTPGRGTFEGSPRNDHTLGFTPYTGEQL